MGVGAGHFGAGHFAAAKLGALAFAGCLANAAVLEGGMALAGGALAGGGDAVLLESVPVGGVGGGALAKVSGVRLLLGDGVSSCCSTFMLGRAFCFLKAAAASFCVGLISPFTPDLGMGVGTPLTLT